MSVVGCKPFGVTKAGEPVVSYTLRNEVGMTAEVLTYGATLRKLSVPGRDGFADVVLGYDAIEGYEKNGKYMGAVVGRCANRIADARFVLGGKTYSLQKNNGENSLHGGFDGFFSRVWSASIEQDALVLRYHSPNGEAGYPGNLDTSVTYRLEEDGLSIEYHAVSDADTVVNLSNHAYFNLNGHDAGTILDHSLKLYANFFLPTDAAAIPTGELRPVDQTPFDFRNPTRIGERIHNTDQQLLYGTGYDHTYLIKPENNPVLMPIACLTSEESGRKMECWSTQPGVQFYSGNHLDGVGRGKNDARYTMCTGVCLETQNWPNAINQANFPSPVLRAGQTYHQKTVYRFSVIE